MKQNNNQIQNQMPAYRLSAVRSRFFAQYWGTKTLYVGGVGLVEIGKGGWNLKHPDFFLQLKSLSSYTKEDSIEVERIWRTSDTRVEEYFKNSYPNTVHDDRELIGRSLIKYWLEENKLNFQNRIDYRTIQHITDFLRSKGYALPFMDYSVKDLISFGWIRLL